MGFEKVGCKGKLKWNLMNLVRRLLKAYMKLLMGIYFRN